VKIAALAQSPVFGGRVKNLDDAAAKAVKGVRQIVRLDDAVAVVADHMGAAKKGLTAFVIEWDDGPHAKLTTEEVASALEKATLNSAPVAQNIGDVDKAMASAAAKVEAIYEVPFLAHAAMEPMNCTVHVREDGCEVWVGTQVLARAQAAAAKAAGLPLEKVVVHNHLIGADSAGGWRSTASLALLKSQSTSTVPSRSSGRARKTSSTTCIGPIGSTGCPPASMRRECPSSGITALQAPRSLRDGSLRRSTMVSTPTAPTARSISPITSQTCASSICGSSPPAFRLRSGAASGRRTMSL
jgi:hypothetical protein